MKITVKVTAKDIARGGTAHSPRAFPVGYAITRALRTVPGDLRLASVQPTAAYVTGTGRFSTIPLPEAAREFIRAFDNPSSRAASQPAKPFQFDLNIPAGAP